MKKLIILFLLINTLVFSDEIFIVCGAGYKRPLQEIAKQYEEEKGIKVNCIFGNMRQIITYAKNSDKISIIVGDNSFLKKSKLLINKKQKIGKGKLILAFKKDFNIKNIKDLKSEEIKKIGMPDPKKTIYGNAAKELLTNTNLYNVLEKKLIILQTIPQVSSYLHSGEIDAGLINITDYLGIKNDNLKSIEVDQKNYSEIIIESGLIDYNNEPAVLFYNYLRKDQAIQILKKYGM